MKKFFSLLLVVLLFLSSSNVFASSPRPYYKRVEFIVKDLKVLDGYDETFNPVYSPD